MHVYASRYTPGLKPGDGDKIAWEVGEVVRITEGQDEGRLFKVLSDRMTHPGAPGEYVREGVFADGEPPFERFAKVERYLWFAGHSEADRESGIRQLFGSAEPRSREEG